MINRITALLLFVGLAWGQEELHGLWGNISSTLNEKYLREVAEDVRQNSKPQYAPNFQNKTDYEILKHLRRNFSGYEDLPAFFQGPIWQDHLKIRAPTSTMRWTYEVERINAKTENGYYTKLFKIFESNGKLFLEVHYSGVETYVIHEPLFGDYYIENWVTLDENEQEVKRKTDIVLIDKNTILISKAQYNRINE